MQFTLPEPGMRQGDQAVPTLLPGRSTGLRDTRSAPRCEVILWMPFASPDGMMAACSVIPWRPELPPYHLPHFRITCHVGH